MRREDDAPVMMRTLAKLCGDLNMRIRRKKVISMKVRTRVRNWHGKMVSILRLRTIIHDRWAAIC